MTGIAAALGKWPNEEGKKRTSHCNKYLVKMETRWRNNPNAKDRSLNSWKLPERRGPYALNERRNGLGHLAPCGSVRCCPSWLLPQLSLECTHHLQPSLHGTDSGGRATHAY